MTIDEHTENLRAAERRLQDAQLSSDVGVLDELLDDAGRFTGPDGALYTKQDDLRAHESRHQVLTRLEEEELHVLAAAHSGVTWLLCSLEGSVGGQPVAARVRYTRSWMRGPEGWKIVAAHATFVGDGALGQ
jgi:ketosteroid isomerase-like protein